MAVSCGRQHTLLLTREGVLLAFGYAGNGELGQRVPNNRSETPVEVECCPLRGREILVFSAGNECSFIACAACDGAAATLYALGKNFCGKLGLRRPSGGASASSIAAVEELERKRVLEVACGMNHTLVWVEGEVYAFGDGEEGQCGHGDRQVQPVPRPIPGLTGTVTAIAAGGHHSVVASTAGLFTFGYGSAGQLGHGDFEPSAVPRRCDYFDSSSVHIRGVACGRLQTYVWVSVADEGCPMSLQRTELYAFGDGGCLGVGDSRSRNVPTRVQLPSDEEIAMVAAGDDHCLVLTRSNRLYSFGRGANGELGYPLAEGEEFQLVPRSVPYFAAGDIPLGSVSAGLGFSIALSKDGSKFYAFGANQHGQLGCGDRLPRTTPVEFSLGSNTINAAPKSPRPVATPRRSAEELATGFARTATHVPARPSLPTATAQVDTEANPRKWRLQLSSAANPAAGTQPPQLANPIPSHSERRQSRMMSAIQSARDHATMYSPRSTGYGYRPQSGRAPTVGRLTPRFAAASPRLALD
eukprot:TRINITY_DN22957_c0_g1_i1.p1 TRINITY_DN22957_c0_g1~~TRINITY_DN22957_c0_g1_i1.p1  ORF type:complete len:551 (+),score=32.72 TRINITY_DN22957_c0_g1_i1:77-1654(+)